MVSVGITGAVPAFALTINPMVADGIAVWTGTDNRNLSLDRIGAIVGVSDLQLYYKQEVGAATDSGLFGASYETNFSNPTNDPEDALIEWGGFPRTHISGTSFLYIKDGKHQPAYYIYSLAALNWNGTDEIRLEGFWPQQGAISNINITGPGSNVPDSGSTAVLLAAALTAFGVYTRRKKLLQRHTTGI